jgi:hypothetical protein
MSGFHLGPVDIALVIRPQIGKGISSFNGSALGGGSSPVGRNVNHVIEPGVVIPGFFASHADGIPVQGPHPVEQRTSHITGSGVHAASPFATSGCIVNQAFGITGGYTDIIGIILNGAAQTGTRLAGPD